MTSTKLIRNITNPLDSRLTNAEGKINAIEVLSLVEEGDYVSLLVNDANYQNETQVDAKIQAVVGGATEALNTLKEIGDALADDDDAIAALVAQDANNANAITAIQGVNSTQSTAISALQTENATQASAIDVLDLRGKIRRLTLTGNLTLTNSDFSRQHLINQTGGDRTIGLPSSPVDSKEFEVINSSTSTNNLIFAGETITPGNRHVVQWDSVEWLVM